MIDPSFVGHVFPSVTTDIERGRLRFFAKAIGQTEKLYTDLNEAMAKGYPDLPVPPTFLFGLQLETGMLDQLAALLKIEAGHILHGEQEFCYHRMVHAGESVSFCSVIDDIYQKKEGKLEFVVVATTILDQAETAVADMHSVFVVKH